MSSWHRAWAALLVLTIASPVRAQTARRLDVAGRPSIFADQLGTTGPTVVVIHGGAGVSHDYLRPEWDLLANTARVVYYDQRGCGRSDHVLPYSWTAHLEDLERVITAAVGARGSVVLAGSSWGTRLAILYAAQHPQRVSAVVLTGTPLWPAVASSRWRERLPDSTRARVDSMEAGIMVHEDVRHDSLQVATTNPHIPAAVAGRLARSGLCGDVALATTATLVSLPALQVLTLPMPVLYVGDDASGAGSTTEAAWEELRPRLPRGERATIAGGGHDPWFTQSAAFFARVQSFLRATSADGRRP